MAFQRYTMFQLIDRLGLEMARNDYLEECPFCGAKRTLHIKEADNTWRCNKCGTNGAVLHFFSKLYLNRDLPASHDGRQEVSEKLQEFMGGSSASAFVPAVQKPRAPRIRVAPDKVLDAVYSVILNIANLALSDADKDALMKRGLSEEAIVRNGYRTIPKAPTIREPYLDLYKKLGGDRERQAIFGDRVYSANNILVGLMIGSYVVEKGLDPKGVPGFYQFGGQWCFWANPGILIPTRNIQGQIVAFQVRQNRKPKYMTLHCSSLPAAVTEPVSRCHFPLGNAGLSQQTPVYFTEGPLKADVAQHLMGKPCIFMAIPGVKTTKDMLKNIPALKRGGVSVLHNALDMDRYTNPNVASGSRELCGALLEQGVSVKQLCWGAEYASYKLAMFTSLCMMRGIQTPVWRPGTPVHEQLALVNQALLDAGIEPCKVVIPGKKAPEHIYWESKTKGIDDYLLSQRSK